MDKVNSQEVVRVENDPTRRLSIGFCLLTQDGKIIWLSDTARHWLRNREGACNQNLFQPHWYTLCQEHPLVVNFGVSLRFIALPFKFLVKGENKPLLAVVIIPTFETKLKEVADHFCLSIREIEVLQDMIKGLSFKQIASHLKIALPTVQVYRTRLAYKLRLNNPGELTGWFWKTFVTEWPGKTDFSLKT